MKSELYRKKYILIAFVWISELNQNFLSIFKALNHQISFFVTFRYNLLGVLGRGTPSTDLKYFFYTSNSLWKK